MNNSIFTRVLTLATLTLLVGCAARPDCTSAVEAGEAAARQYRPPGEWVNSVDAACADSATAKWNTLLARECAPVYGFHAALNGTEKPAGCGSAAGFVSAWNLGEMIGDMRRETEEIERRLEDGSLPSETRRELERRRAVIDRDLPQLEALARMDGYLPPAEVPGTGQGATD